MMFITIEEAKRHLRIDDDADVDDVELKAMAATGAVRNYLKSGADAYFDQSGVLMPDAVPYVVKAATLLMLGYLYKDRDEDSAGAYEQGYLPKPVTALLYSLRSPAFA
jgi:hypothetical protein